MPSKMGTNGAIRREEKTTGIWQAPGRDVVVEYSTQVLEELRAAGEEGFQKIPHGGIEVGALLLGTRDPGVVRVLEWRPIECEHAKGPGFVLSAKDMAGLDALLNHCQQAPELRSLQPVGWFHTHTRSKIFLSPDDLVIHNRFFSAPDDVALVMRLTKDQAASAGFFVRDASGALQPEASPLEFTIVPDPSALLGPTRLTAARRGAPSRRDRPVRPAGDAHSPSPAPQTVRETPRTAVHQEPPADAPLEPPFHPVEPVRPHRFAAGKLALALLGVSAIAALAWYSAGWLPAKHSSAALKLEEIEGQLEVRWDRGSRAVRVAERGTVTIQDGAQRRGIDLSEEDVRRGSVFYTRTAEDLQVRLELYKGDEVILQEMARFLGQAVPERAAKPSGETQAPDRVREDIEQLKARVADEAKRGRELEKQVREAEDRLRRETAKR